ncbi:hypothetical protein HMH01_09885 [Halovulum dunhuangense]|uniref:Uncharacterized protein n=1 Tax=Halovulum dunhuangense TaxID=1505036 RepID=A0A849L333_9RHOB|nr:hypothetical protein [Halovulum dunhuangense]NNU80746.1 hypothetical protein [Halovulum dunhuangense]
MSRFREPAMIEPEPVRRVRQPGEGGGKLPFVFGLLMGLGGMAAWLAYPEIPDALVALYDQQVATLPEQYRGAAPFAAGAVAALLLYAVRRPLLKSPLVLAAVIGAALWIPLGQHMLGLVPQIEQAMPGLRPGLESLVASNDALTQLSGLGQRYIPVPGSGSE